MRNKLKLVLGSLLLLHALVGCEKNYALFNVDTSALHPSLEMYYALDSKPFKGDNFETKLIDMVFVPFVDAYNNDITYYRYRIVIAPVYNKSMQIKSIRVEPMNEEITMYLSEKSPIGTGNLDIWNSITEKLDFEKWTETEDYIAFELSITFNNLTGTFMEKQGISNFDLEQAMKNLTLMITFNNSTEEIFMENLVLTPYDAVDMSKRIDIQELIQNGETFDQLAPYTNE